MDPNHTHAGMSMHMSFYWGKDAIMLFPEWPNHSLGMYILSLFFVFFLAIFAEVLGASPGIKRGGLNLLVSAMIHAAMYAVHIALSYLIMLSVMSFNIGIFIAAVIGHSLGFFIVKYHSLASANYGNTNSSAKL